MSNPHLIRYEATKRMRCLNPRGVWRIKSAEDQRMWTAIGPALRMKWRREIAQAKLTRGTIAWLIEQAVLPPRPKR